MTSSTPPSSSSDLGQAGPSKTTAKKAKTKSTKTKSKGKKRSLEDEDERTSPSKLSRTRLHDDQIRTVLARFDLEAEENLRKLKLDLDMALSQASSSADAKIMSLSKSILGVTVETFLREGNGNVLEFLSSRPAHHLEKSQDEWERAKRTKTWNSSAAAPSADGDRILGDVTASQAMPPTSSSGVAADSEASSKPVKKPPIARQGATTKSSKSKNTGAGPSRATRRASVVVRTQQGEEFDVETASTSQLEEMGLTEKDVTELRAILLKMKA
ncbi:hypothetical protein V8E36_009014 [Tilletia maclaganii]